MVATAKDNQGAEDLTLDQLADIYGGSVNTWPDGGRLRLVLRPPRDSDTVLLKGISPALDRTVTRAQRRKGMVVAMTDQDSAEMIENTEGAIGTSLLSLIVAEKRNLRVLAIDGVAPSVQAMQNGRYPYFKTFRLVIPPRPGGPTQLFLDFMRTPVAREIIRKNGSQAL